MPLSDLHETLDKLFTEVDHLDRVTDVDDFDRTHIMLALSIAKRVRTQSTILVRCLAATRDQLQPNGGTSE